MMSSIYDSCSSSNDTSLLDLYFESVPIMGGTVGIESMYGMDSDSSNNDDPTPDPGV